MRSRRLFIQRYVSGKAAAANLKALVSQLSINIDLDLDEWVCPDNQSRILYCGVSCRTLLARKASSNPERWPLVATQQRVFDCGRLIFGSLVLASL